MKIYSWIALIIITLLPVITGNNAVRAAENKLSLADARHLLTRSGFGASPHEINKLIGKSRQAAVTIIVDGLDSQTLTEPPAWTEQQAPHHFRFPSLSTREKQNFRQTRLNEIQSLRQWWISEMISTPSPQKERLLLFWHNHFATAYSALNNQAISVARQHMMLRDNAAGSFREMLKQIIRDPAMLNYLDNNASKKQKPNENLAREIMELFSLGEGNYTEADIKNAARALTGNSFSNTYNMQFVFKPWDHDSGTKTLFGKTGEFDGDDLVDIILEQPAAANFIAARFWRMLVGDIKTNDPTIAPHANAFRNSDYDIKTLYSSILLSDDFWDLNNRNGLVKSPVALLVGTIRSTGILPADWQTLPLQLRQMGQYLFEPPNVAGWPGGSSWITPGRLLTRLDWLEQFTKEADRNLQQPEQAMTMTMAEQPASASGKPSENSMASGSSNLMQSQNQLSIRMASEEFDEHVKYRLKVRGRNNTAWDSGLLELTGGHDTKLLGRIQPNNLPWQTITHNIPVKEQDVSSIEISFVNDGTTPDGADRNLYISRAMMGNKIWLPSDGKQTGKCPRKNAAHYGNIYCPGTLTMTQSRSTDTAETDPLNDLTMRVSGVSLNFVRPFNRKPITELVYTLSDVEFNGKYWHTLNVKYTKHKHGHAVRLSTIDCWPECVTEWPACAKPNKHGIKNLSFELEKDERHCMLKGLHQSDKNLATALWMIVDDLYTIGLNDPKQQRQGVARNYQQWQKIVDTAKNRLPESAFFNSAIELEIAPRPAVDVTLAEPLVIPVPAGRSESQRTADIHSLIKNNPGTTLRDLLLPAEPVNRLSDTASMNDILTDLSYQLQ